ncbi:MAG: response regulator transcription factor [Cyclobacteriaceae bacterium]
MMTSKPNILLVEDDINLGYVIKDNLEANDYVVEHATDGKSGLKLFFGSHFDLCLLDVMLPETDGFSIAKTIRDNDDQIPIIFLTAKSMKEDRIEGFKLGGDDYIVKPFNIEELILRIQVFLRRSSQDRSYQNTFSIGTYQFNYKNLMLSLNGKNKILTQKEGDILRQLCLHQDQIIKREEILNRVWGDDDYFIGRSLDVFIYKLRRYLQGDPKVEIINVHSVGFKLVHGKI